MQSQPAREGSRKFRDRVLAEPSIAVKKFENFYKPERKLDMEGSYVVLLGYADLKAYFGIRTDYPSDLNLITITFEKFARDRRALADGASRTVLLPVELFVDQRVLESQDKPRLWRIFESLEYILYCPYYLTPVHLTRRHFIKHFQENEVLKILHNLLDLLKQLSARSLRINFLQFYVVFSENRYKFMVCSLIHSDELQRDFDAQLKFGAFVLYGLLKEMIFAFYNTKENTIAALISLNGEKKLDRFVHAFAIFTDLLTRDAADLDSIARLEQLVVRLLDDYLSTLYVFKNKEIFLLNQPVFRYIKRLHIEVNASVDRLSNVLEFVAKTLAEKEELLLLFLKLSECLMSSGEAVRILKALSGARALEYLLLDFSYNNLDDTVVEHLCNVHVRSLKSFRTDFSGSTHQHEPDDRRVGGAARPGRRPARLAQASHDRGAAARPHLPARRAHWTALPCLRE